MSAIFTDKHNKQCSKVSVFYIFICLLLYENGERNFQFIHSSLDWWQLRNWERELDRTQHSVLSRPVVSIVHCLDVHIPVPPMFPSVSNFIFHPQMYPEDWSQRVVLGHVVEPDQSREGVSGVLRGSRQWRSIQSRWGFFLFFFLCFMCEIWNHPLTCVQCPDYLLRLYIERPPFTRIVGLELYGFVCIMPVCR